MINNKVVHGITIILFGEPHSIQWYDKLKIGMSETLSAPVTILELPVPEFHDHIDLAQKVEEVIVKINSEIEQTKCFTDQYGHLARHKVSYIKLAPFQSYEKAFRFCDTIEKSGLVFTHLGVKLLNFRWLNETSGYDKLSFSIYDDVIGFEDQVSCKTYILPENCWVKSIHESIHMNYSF